jgi:two-component system cell cycle sensor histidine kinase/response regulator CckA
LRRLIGENIELKVVHGRDLGLVKVDQGQLDQVIINLAVNAPTRCPVAER